MYHSCITSVFSMVFRSIIPVVMARPVSFHALKSQAGVLGIYGLITAVLPQVRLETSCFR